MSRKTPNLTEQVAALHIEIQAIRGNPIADWSVLRQMTAKQINSLFQWHHVTYDAWIEEAQMRNHPSVITPLYIVAHRERTAKIDIPQIAKTKRITAKQNGTAEPKQKIRSRGFPSKEERARVKALYGRSQHDR